MVTTVHVAIRRSRCMNLFFKSSSPTQASSRHAPVRNCGLRHPMSARRRTPPPTLFAAVSEHKSPNSLEIPVPPCRLAHVHHDKWICVVSMTIRRQQQAGTAVRYTPLVIFCTGFHLPYRSNSIVPSAIQPLEPVPAKHSCCTALALGCKNGGSAHLEGWSGALC